MPAYYNEFEPYAVDWLERLIAVGLLPDGDVDRRSILDVRPDDLKGYDQCHFFAGIGGWGLALRMVGWPDDRPVWTGSCPCQPFSVAGQRKGEADERHLWPVWFGLIRQCQPAVVFGEQVEGAVRLGWVDAVQRDLEAEGYAFGMAVLGAHSVGAPHIRQRLWFVADAMHSGRAERRPGAGHGQAAGRGGVGLMGHAGEPGLEGRGVSGRGRASECAVGAAGGDAGELADADRERRVGLGLLLRAEEGERNQSAVSEAAGRGDAGELADAERDGQHRSGHAGQSGRTEPANGSRSSFWSHADWIECRDGKARPTQSGLFPLAHGIPGRVGRLRAYGNAIVPQVAAEFIAAYLDCRE